MYSEQLTFDRELTEQPTASQAGCLQLPRHRSLMLSSCRVSRWRLRARYREPCSRSRPTSTAAQRPHRLYSSMAATV